MNNQRQSKPVIGLVGGIGSGKSTAAREFAELGCALIDGDAIGYELLADPDVRNQLRRRWGGKIFEPDGTVSRRELGNIVFNNSAELEALNMIMHPLIGNRIKAEVVKTLSDTQVPAVVLDAAVLFEAGWDELCTHVLFVVAPEEVRSGRAASRGLDTQAWRKRENSQISLDSKEARCYCKLDNSSSVSHLREQVGLVFGRLVPHVDRP